MPPQGDSDATETGDAVSPSPQSTIPTKADLIGLKLGGRYLIEKELGRGGMGAVYLARDKPELHSRPVVVKVLLENALKNEWVVKKFHQEIESLTRLDDAGVVGIFDAGRLDDGTPYLVMQYVEGTTLRAAMKPAGMELQQAATIMRQVGRSVAAAHDVGIFHRDLKPENIMLRATAKGDQQVKIIDFGIAKVKNSVAGPATVTGSTAGTIAYMSPEQLTAKPLTPASDIYALGMIAYEMVTGRNPFNPESIYQLLEMQRAGVRVKPCDLRPALPETAQGIILKALAFDPTDRFQRADEFGDQLAGALTSEYDPGERATQQMAARMSAGAGNDLPKTVAAESLQGARTEPSKPTLETAHVLFMDIVGYSKLLIDEQSDRLQELKDIVRATQEFQRAQLAGQLLSLPTGDGMALSFFGDPESPVRCAVEVSRALREHPDVKLRMGAHSGLVYRVADINENLNISGGGINMAQRVMDCGDAGHILLSNRVADDLAQLSRWANDLHDLGEAEVKHGVRVHVYSLYNDEIGNSEIPAKLRQPELKPVPKRALLVAASLVILAVIGVGGFFALRSALAPRRSLTYSSANSGETSQPTEPERTLSYSLLVQKCPQGKPCEEPFRLPDATYIFEESFRVRLNVTTPQPGYFYVLNESLEGMNGARRYIILYPSENDRQDAVLQIEVPKNDWFQFDNQKGTEKLWVVWSQLPVPELEAVKYLANERDRGKIKDANQNNAIDELLRRYSALRSGVEKDETNRQTNVKAKGGLIVYAISLEHR